MPLSVKERDWNSRIYGFYQVFSKTWARIHRKPSSAANPSPTVWLHCSGAFEELLRERYHPVLSSFDVKPESLEA